ncbi:thiol:disulfide interchange protein DsbA [Catenovulum agarivorans DS-2]|uniref:Thiol:disulfide interchange protein n=1 Tax=Catenovulum agarivorans DS-2 TaxID=1328313 RepID=W7Q7Z3_9ALTE|nr:thiol:disulfide interchange protein DsbA/DsbL [Catenovulum agarivorans]EWH08914.1 thiol:disulfide interchange protein DsbA [Catenovulum agarivorans DS-2]
MKKLTSLLFALVLFPLAACAEQFKEGTHYTVLAKAATAQPEVKEFFSFYCPHCYSFEPIVAKIKQDLPADASFKKSHVDFMPRNNKPVAQGLGKSLAALELLKAEDAGVAAIFNHLHKDKKRFASMAEVRDVVVNKAGVEPTKYDSAYNSFMAAGRANQMQTEQRSFNIRSVPTFIVNGKYQIELGSVKSEEEYVALVKFLLNKK